MYPYKKTKIYVSPWTAILLAGFIWFSSPVLLAALLLAALIHELGHYVMLRHFRVPVASIHISPFGAKMCLDERRRLSYGAEMLTVFAGPFSNLVSAFLLAALGQWWEMAYLFSGAQLVLGLFNLLPVRPLDGGTFVWLLLAWCTEPFTADRISQKIGICTVALLILTGAAVLYLEGGSPFLLLGAAGPLWFAREQKKLVKARGNR